MFPLIIQSPIEFLYQAGTLLLNALTCIYEEGRIGIYLARNALGIVKCSASS